jgi:hypothetical protein
LWNNRTQAREAMQVLVEAGPVGAAVIDQNPDGLFVETKQRFAVNGVDFEYRHLSLRYLDFLLPQADLIALPLARDAQVRITYRRDGGQKQLLRFEIATNEFSAHD